MEKEFKKSLLIGGTMLLLVMLILVGLTYAYYRTRIVDNKANKSISVTSKKLELTYGDGNGVLSATGIAPGEIIKFKTESGSEVTEKTFTVENTGDDTVSYGIYLEDVINEFERVEDLKLTLTCNTCDGASINYPKIDTLLTMNTIDAGEIHTYSLSLEYVNHINIDQSIDMGKSLSGIVQLYDLSHVLDNNTTLAYKILSNAKGSGSTTYRSIPLSIPAQQTSTIHTQRVSSASATTFSDTSYYTYSEELKFNELSGYSLINPQVVSGATLRELYSEGKTLYLRRENGKTQAALIDSNGNPSERTQTIKDMVRVDRINGDTLTYSMLELNATNESVEKTLSATLDDYGISFYYRGDVEDNYVTYNGMCWRIVRVQGDGSVKLVLESTSVCSDSITQNYLIATGPYGANYYETTGNIIEYLNPSYNSEKSMRASLNNWLTNNNFDTTELRNGDWCLGNRSDAYDFNAPYNLLEETPDELIASKSNFNLDGFKRIYRQYPEQALLLCDGLKAVDDYIGALTIDEVVFAGGKNGFASNTIYLIENHSFNSWWTMTPAYYENLNGKVFLIDNTNVSALKSNFDEDVGFRPSIVLKSSVKLAADSGNGTINSPYIVE